MALLQTPFGATTTALEVVEGVDLAGQVAIITGGASGIGVETARALAHAGARVVLAVRDINVGRTVAGDLHRAVGRTPIEVAPLELTSRTSVDAFVSSWSGPLHMLINNAAVMAPPLTRTSDGHELQFATNHLGHMALTLGLRRALAAANGARVVNVSSSGHLTANIDFDDVHFERRDYGPWVGYGQSKTANILFSVGLQQRWKDDGIMSNALMPGGIMTKLQRFVPRETLDKWAAAEREGKLKMKTPAQGAATTVLLAASSLLHGVGGRYFEDCNEAETIANDVRASRGVRAYALDREAAGRLWDVSLSMLSQRS
jgi:NAD(P)-dependent dehydrogenase (short-subunit alcohol dehydrogenase family)